MSFDQTSDGFYQTNYDHGGGQHYGHDQQPGYGQGSDYGYTAPGGYPQQTFQPGAYSGEILQPQETIGAMPPGSGYENSFEDEPPLLEELGINFDHISKKTLAVLHPLSNTDPSIINETDLAGPFCFCLTLGGTLLLGGKVHFGYIYGIGGMGVLAMYILLNLMTIDGVSMGCVASIIGYCILPMVILSAASLVMSLQGLLGIILSVLCVGWCSLSASKLFVRGLNMESQQLLVAYPCALLYGVFALLMVF